ncbi:MAG: putative RDD family membrane protein YckC [Paraglaciecola sp.]|jgi:uncharacterized RDD family membrane protein YckC
MMQKGDLDLTESANLSHKETREIVTPYAFHVSPDLFGVRLASPLRRAWAILIDIVLIALLTQVSILVLAIVAAATFFKAGNRLKQKKRFNGPRIFLRFLTAALLFLFALGIFGTLQEEFNIDTNGVRAIGDQTTGSNGLNINSVAGVALSAKYLIKTSQLSKQIEQGKCAIAYDCWQGLGNELSADLLETGLTEENALGVLSVFSEATENSLTSEEIQQLQTYLKQQYLQHPLGIENSASKQQFDDQIELKAEESAVLSPHLEKGVKRDSDKKIGESSFNNNPSLIGMLTGFAEDLGLGFGWAAFYFSIFTAWWKGQTPGKRLLGIKVLKLDGSSLNLWDSFGRYGGYGAGLATGLLGFLQIYWDPNRQAIQDKISETLVIDLGKKKVAFEHPIDMEP